MRNVLLLAAFSSSLFAACSSPAPAPAEHVAFQSEDVTKACSKDAQCSGATPACLPSGTCGQCTASNALACTGATPICDPVSSKCVACPNGKCPSAAPTCSLSAAAANLALGKSTS